MSNHEPSYDRTQWAVGRTGAGSGSESQGAAWQYNAEYKRRILAEAGVCTQAAQIGALLRRERLYSSHLTSWRRQLEKGSLQELSPKARGHKAGPQAAEIGALRRANECLGRVAARRNDHCGAKNLSELLGPPSRPALSDGSPCARGG